MINLSLHEGLLHNNWKAALVRPLLKKMGLELIRESFRPISNLSLESKVTEKAVACQPVKHCEANAPLLINQLSYRQIHSSETALMKVQNDILVKMDQQEVTLLIL